MESLNEMMDEMQDHITATGSLDKIPELILKIKAQTLIVQELAVKKKTEDGILKALETEGLEALVANEMKEFSNSEGTIKLSTRRSTKKPAHGSPEWDELKEYLIAQDLWENMATVNATSLSSWFNAQMKEHEDDPTFVIPGLEKKEYTTLKFNRNKV